MGRRTKEFGVTVVLASLALLTVALGLCYQGGFDARFVWLLSCFALLAFLVGFGAAAQGLWRGIFISRSNNWSLSHTYTVLWSVLILGTLVTVLALRLGAGLPADDFFQSLPDADAERGQVAAFQPFDIGIDQSLLTLMVITTGSFFGAKAIAVRPGRDRKKTDVVEGDEDGEVELGLTLLRNQPRRVRRRLNQDAPGARELAQHVQTRLNRGELIPGDLAGLAKETGTERHLEEFRRAVRAEGQRRLQAGGRPEACEATMMDLLAREDLQGHRHPDLGRAQLLVFTFIAMVGFALTAWSFFGASPCDHRGTCIDSVPTISSGLVSLIGASHAGYLGSKLVEG